MKNRKILAYFAIFLIIIFLAIRGPSDIQAINEEIPSDLNLDLKFAEQNPAPAQKQIIQSQTPQAQITTSNGDQISITVKDIVPPDIKTQSSKDAINPEQTTSEQVVNKTEVSDQTQPSSSTSEDIKNPATSPADTNQNVIPGTAIVEPDDNAAPVQPASSNPSLNSTSTENSPIPTNLDNSSSTNNPNSVNSQPSPNSDTQQGTSNTQSSEPQSNTIPPENGAAPVSIPTSDNSNSSPGNPNSDSTSGSNSSSSDSNNGSNTDNSAVQGVSTGPNISLWQQFINKVFKVFTK